MSDPSSHAETFVEVPRAEAFARALSIDLRRILRGYRGLPSVEDISDQTGNWDAVGQTRRVHLSDGTSVIEELTLLEPHDGYGYRIHSFPSPIGRLASEANGRWRFSDKGNGTHISWRFTFRPRNAAARILLVPMIALLWRGYMGKAMAKTKAIVEGGNEAPSTE